MLSVRILVALALSLATLPFLSTAAVAEDPCVYSGLHPGGFEIEGDLAECEFTDWESDGVPDPASDGFDDATQFTEGSKEMDNPSTWVNATGTAPGKDDIGDVYLYNTTVNGTIWSFFGFFRDANTGTTAYDVEYNQAKNMAGSSPSRPNRTAGDLLIQVTQQGNGAFEITDAFEWTVASPGGSLDKDCYTIGGYSPASGWCPLPKANWDDAFVGATSADRFFAEGALNISEVFGEGTCIGDFGTMNIRSRASDVPTSALKDWVRPLDVDIEGTCKDLVIEKWDASTNTRVGVAGTTFEISPNPIPGSGGVPDPAYVVDNEGASDITPAEATAGQLPDEDNTVGRIKITDIEPGPYTVTETVAPSGYFMAPAPPGGVCQPITTTEVSAYRCATQVIDEHDGKFIFEDKKIWQAPTITKTAAGYFDTSYTWDIEKTVSATSDEATPDDKASKNVAEGDTATFYYGVKVIGTESKGSYRVTGHVTVVNPNDDDMVVTLSDAIENGDDDIACAFDDDADGGDYEVTVPPSADGPDDGNALDGTPYDYTCTLAKAQYDAGVETNRATVTWDLSKYPQADTPNPWNPSPATDSEPASADFTFAAVGDTDKTVVVTDDYSEFGGPYNVTFGDAHGATVGNTYTRSWDYDVTFDHIPAGTCTDYDNTAEVRSQTESLLDSATATATVCVGSDLQVVKNVVTKMTRTYTYAIDKTATSSSLEVNPATGRAVANYSVVVTDGPANDSAWQMSGVITVTNPNEREVTLTDITDQYPGGTCSVTKGDLKIPAEDFSTDAVEGQRKFDYSCIFTAKPTYTGTNQAKITWDAKDNFTSGNQDTYGVVMTAAQWESVESMTKVNDKVTVVDNKTVPGQSITLGEVTWQASGFKHPAFTYSLELAGSPGRCVSYNNTARIVQTGQSDSASVTVCYPVSPTVDKTAGGTYDRTYLWQITKEADQTSVETDGENGAEVSYTVTAKPDGYVDGGWTMNGTITVSNPNDFKSMTVDITDVPNVGPGTTCTVTGGTGVVVPAGTFVNGAVVPGTATRSYICSVPQQPLYQGGTNTAVITWAGGSASSPARPVVFALAGETNKTVEVIDDKTVDGSETSLGTATWNDLGTPTEFTYSLALEAAANECETYTNTAEIVETGQFADATVEACGPEVLPAEEVAPRPPVVKGVEKVLPSTGGPQLGLAWVGLGMLLAGGALLATRRWRRSES